MAISLGNVSVVAPIDKLSVVIAVVGSIILFKEKIKWQGWLGLVILIIGTLLLLILMK